MGGSGLEPLTSCVSSKYLTGLPPPGYPHPLSAVPIDTLPLASLGQGDDRQYQSCQIVPFRRGEAPPGDSFHRHSSTVSIWFCRVDMLELTASIFWSMAPAVLVRNDIVVFSGPPCELSHEDQETPLRDRCELPTAFIDNGSGGSHSDGFPEGQTANVLGWVRLFGRSAPADCLRR